MGESAIQTLEAAAQVFLAGPNLVSSEQRHQAESVFLEFRSTKQPYQLCREILEKSGSEFVLFEAAGLIKSALVKEWDYLSEEDIVSLRQYMLEYVLNREVPMFLREKLVQTIAIMIKRGSIQDGGRKRKAFLTELEKIILSSPSTKHQKLACSIILAIMQEYATTVKTTDVGIAWEVHYRLKKNFEALELKRIFRFGVSALEQIAQVAPQPEGDLEIIIKQLLSIVEMVLCWGQVSPLLTKRLIGAFEAIYESEQTPALRLPAIWKDTILQPELISLFFKIHLYVRCKTQLVNSSLTCLVQLASLSGMLVTDMAVRKQYLENYVKFFLNMMSNIEPTEREMLSFADIFRRLVQFFTPSMIASLPLDLLHNLTKLTCHCIEAAILEESISDDTLWKEALNKYLHTWSVLVQDTEGFSGDALQEPCIEIFNKYLQCRLAPPDGTRGLHVKDGLEDIEVDLEEDEREVHAYVLVIIGFIARKAPDHCTHVLLTLLQNRGKRLGEQLQSMFSGTLPISAGEAMIALFEDLHWILMITGHFLAQDCTEGETVMVPPEIIQYSNRKNSNIEASLRYLVGESNSIENVDPILSLVGEVLRISAYEVAALEAGMGQGFSPEVSATLSWLLKIWANSYLMYNHSLYSEISAAFECAWGSGSTGVSWVLSRLVQRAVACLKHMTSLPPAPTQALQLLTTIAYIQDKKARLANNEDFLALVSWEANGCNLPGRMRKELHRAFTIASMHATGDVKNRLEASTMALHSKLSNLIALESDTEPIRNMISDSLECIVGVIEGVREALSINKQCTMLIGSIESIPVILYRYHNYPSVVLPALQLLTKFAKRMLHSVTQDNVTTFLNVCNTSFEVYGRWNSSKISSIPLDAEDEAYDDLCALMELICSIARSYVDNVHSICAAGLRLTLPLITPSLLALPRLAHAAYRMLRDLEVCEQIRHLPIEDFNVVVNALSFGLTAVSCDVSSLCCDTIAGLAMKLLGASEDNLYAKTLLSLSEILLLLVMKKELPADTIPSAGSAIYCLTCVRPPQLEAIARQLITMFSGNDALMAQRLEDAFRVLTTNVVFDGLRNNKIKFQENFDKFTTAVNAFLVVR